MSLKSHSVSVHHEGHVAAIVFANAPNNHISTELLSDLGAALEGLDAEPDCRAIVLASDGKPFCAGADLASGDGLGGVAANPIRQFYDQALRLFATKKPVIAAVQGAAIGAGLGLAVAADFRVAAKEARFSANFTRLGFHPGFGLTHTLPRLIGAQRASLMFMTSRRFKADEAADWGLVDQVVDAGSLREAAMNLAHEIAENAPLALLATRKTVRGTLLADVTRTLEHELAEQAILRKTADYAEGVASVFERRPANFTGR
jgi:enoyl-CoA hydratase/carnithine racemase